MKVSTNPSGVAVRFSELKPGDVFSACGDPAIKTVDSRAIVLTDGNYVSRMPSDLVTPLTAEIIISEKSSHTAVSNILLSISEIDSRIKRLENEVAYHKDKLDNIVVGAEGVLEVRR